MIHWDPAVWTSLFSWQERTVTRPGRGVSCCCWVWLGRVSAWPWYHILWWCRYHSVWRCPSWRGWGRPPPPHCPRSPPPGGRRPHCTWRRLLSCGCTSRRYHSWPRAVIIRSREKQKIYKMFSSVCLYWYWYWRVPCVGVGALGLAALRTLPTVLWLGAIGQLAAVSAGQGAVTDISYKKYQQRVFLKTICTGSCSCVQLYIITGFIKQLYLLKQFLEASNGHEKRLLKICFDWHWSNNCIVINSYEAPRGRCSLSIVSASHSIVHYCPDNLSIMVIFSRGVDWQHHSPEKI